MNDSESLLGHLLTILLVTSMLGAGLRTSFADFKALAREGDLLLRVLIANFFAVPVIGLVMIKQFHIVPEMAAAFALVAFTPGSVGTIQFTSRYKGREPLAAALAVLLSTLAIFFSPAMLNWVLPEQYPASLPYGTAALFVVLAMFAPMIIGMAIRHRLPTKAGHLGRWMGILSLLLYGTYIAMYYITKRDTVHPIALDNLGYMLGFVLLTLVAGFLFGGPDPITRTILAHATSMRHISLSLLIAAATFNNANVAHNLTAFTLLMIGSNAIFALGMRIYLKVKS